MKEWRYSNVDEIVGVVGGGGGVDWRNTGLAVGFGDGGELEWTDACRCCCRFWEVDGHWTGVVVDGVIVDGVVVVAAVVVDVDFVCGDVDGIAILGKQGGLNAGVAVDVDGVVVDGGDVMKKSCELVVACWTRKVREKEIVFFCVSWWWWWL